MQADRNSARRRKFVFIGAGWVGGLTSTFFASNNPDSDFWVYDINAALVDKWKCKQIPFFEHGLECLLLSTLGKNLYFTNNRDDAFTGGSVFFICVHTPTKTKGIGKNEMHDLKYLESCSRDIAGFFSEKQMEENIAIVEKSTVPPKTSNRISELFRAAQVKYPENSNKFCVMSNPEFLAEGVAIRDLTNPDRVIIGAGSDEVSRSMLKVVEDLYATSVPRDRIISTHVYTSELAKLCSNAFLAQRVASINSLTPICESLGIDVDQLSECVGSDARIGNRYLKASCGFGGSCLEKDLLALVYLARSLGHNETADYWRSVYAMNEYQKKRLPALVVDQMHGSMNGHKIAILGVAFKKNTNDCRGSAAISVVRELLEEGCEVHIFDYQVRRDEFVREYCTYLVDEILTEDQLAKIVFHDDEVSACQGSQAILLLTEWDEFKTLKYESLYSVMQKPAYFFDFRCMLDSEVLKNVGFNAFRLGYGF